MNISTDPEIEDNIITNERFDFHILDHPMKPFGIRYWGNYESFIQKEEFLEYHPPRACSWLRDQEYLLDFTYYEDLYHPGHDHHQSYLHIFPKVRLVSFPTA